MRDRPIYLRPNGDCGVYTLKYIEFKSSGILDDLTISSLESLLSSDLL
ncbi:unnamed protein product [Brassica napus]|uniref:(rape) hypothetical protein n=1 Tax=Brassica napus TaxID=3708 RepID=A0A816J3B4_BRANA|nr:unnamed protein product [Brassica napus]